MVVQERATAGLVHFLIFRRRPFGQPTASLIGSGTRTDLTAAKSAAELMAARAESWA